MTLSQRGMYTGACAPRRAKKPHQREVGVLLELSDDLALRPIDPLVRPLLLLHALRLFNDVRDIERNGVGGLLVLDGVLNAARGTGGTRETRHSVGGMWVQVGESVIRSALASKALSRQQKGRPHMQRARQEERLNWQAGLTSSSTAAITSTLGTGTSGAGSLALDTARVACISMAADLLSDLLMRTLCGSGAGAASTSACGGCGEGARTGSCAARFLRPLTSGTEPRGGRLPVERRLARCGGEPPIQAGRCSSKDLVRRMPVARVRSTGVGLSGFRCVGTRSCGASGSTFGSID